MNNGGTDGTKPRVVIEGWPQTKVASDKFEKEVSGTRSQVLAWPRSEINNPQVCPILLIISIDMNGHVDQAIARLKDDSTKHKEAWKRFEAESPALIKRFRLEGNILEVSLGWAFSDLHAD